MLQIVTSLMYQMKSPQTIITYTHFSAGVERAKALVEPPYIDIKYADDTTHRFQVKLQNTFYVNNQIIAVWIADIYLGIVDQKDPTK